MALFYNEFLSEHLLGRFSYGLVLWPRKNNKLYELWCQGNKIKFLVQN